MLRFLLRRVVAYTDNNKNINEIKSIAESTPVLARSNFYDILLFNKY